MPGKAFEEWKNHRAEAKGRAACVGTCFKAKFISSEGTEQPG